MLSLYKSHFTCWEIEKIIDSFAQSTNRMPNSSFPAVLGFQLLPHSQEKYTETSSELLQCSQNSPMTLLPSSIPSKEGTTSNSKIIGKKAQGTQLWDQWGMLGWFICLLQVESGGWRENYPYPKPSEDSSHLGEPTPGKPAPEEPKGRKHACDDHHLLARGEFWRPQ